MPLKGQLLGAVSIIEECEHEVACVLVSHLRKAQGEHSSLDRIHGSVGLKNVMRSVLMVDREKLIDQDTGEACEGRRLIWTGKKNTHSGNAPIPFDVDVEGVYSMQSAAMEWKGKDPFVWPKASKSGSYSGTDFVAEVLKRFIPQGASHTSTEVAALLRMVGYDSLDASPVRDARKKLDIDVTRATDKSGHSVWARVVPPNKVGKSEF